MSVKNEAEAASRFDRLADRPQSRPASDSLLAAVARALRAVRRDQAADGFWCYEFEADCTIPAEYILLAHFTGDPQFTDGLAPDLEARIGTYLRRRQNADGGWSLYPGGDTDLSCSVKAYYALKLIGDAATEPHMEHAREAILARGGAGSVNVFTRITLALFGQLPWEVTPVVPVEIMVLPRWSPVHLSKVSYWSRTVTVPLAVLRSLRARARNPRGIGVPELFEGGSATVTAVPDAGVSSWARRLFFWFDRVASRLEPKVPIRLRRPALRRAEQWIVERLNGEDGLGAIFPAMVNAHEALEALGYDRDHALLRSTAAALKRLVVVHADEAYCQPCVSPVWDTALAGFALDEAAAVAGDPVLDEPLRSVQDSPAEENRRREALKFDRVFERSAAVPLVDAPAAPAPRRSTRAAIEAGLDWLSERQLRDAPGDWRVARPDLAGGGWPFQFRNDYYPDIDDTAVVGWFMHHFDPVRYAEPIRRAAEWVAGMQSANGGFGAFDVDNDHQYLNELPFADHGALLDPPTSDVTARCLGFLAHADRERYRTVIERGLDFLMREQEPEGCWFGRWGTNYLYGTWSVLAALEVVGGASSPIRSDGVRRAVRWIESVQRDDGGWGETNDSYLDRTLMGAGAASTSFHTAWALLGLMAAGEVGGAPVARGVAYLRRTQRPNGLWYDEAFTCPGFPRVFYLKYHGYSRYFPLWALARYARQQT